MVKDDVVARIEANPKYHELVQSAIQLQHPPVAS
jgi:hypothetical protein